MLQQQEALGVLVISYAVTCFLAELFSALWKYFGVEILRQTMCGLHESETSLEISAGR